MTTDSFFIATDKAKHLARHGATHCVYRDAVGHYHVAPGAKPPKEAVGAVLLAIFGVGQPRSKRGARR